MRKDSINSEALQQAYLIYSENGHTIQDFDFSHDPTDYARGTVQEPERVSKLKEAFNELDPYVAAEQPKFDAVVKKREEIEEKIKKQQDHMRHCRMTGNFKQLHDCMRKVKEMIKEKERLDAHMAVYSPAGNVNEAAQQEQKDTWNNYAEMQEIGSKIVELEAALKNYKGE